MEEFTNVDVVETTEQYPEQDQTSEVSYNYDYPVEQADNSNAVAFVAGAFAAGAAVGAVTTKLVGKVREKIAAKKEGKAPVKEKHKFKLQWPIRKETVYEVPATTKAEETPQNPENNQA